MAVCNRSFATGTALFLAFFFAIAIQCARSQDADDNGSAATSDGGDDVEVNCTKLWDKVAQKEALPGEYIIMFKQDKTFWSEDDEGDEGWPTVDEMLEQAQAWFDEVPTKYLTNFSHEELKNEIARYRDTGVDWREYYDGEDDEDLRQYIEGRRSSRSIKGVVTEALHAFTCKFNLTDEPQTNICGVDIPTVLIAMLKSDLVGFIEEEQIFRNNSDGAGDGGGVTIQPVQVTIQSQPDWGLDRIDQQRNNLDEKYGYTVNGTNTIVYVVDSGIQVTHEEFQGRASCGIDLSSFLGLENCADLNGHGTHVAGTVGGITHGVAKGAELVAVRVLDSSGAGSTSDIITGINWVIAQKDLGVNQGKGMVINLSLGGGSSRALNRAVNNAVDAGIFVVVAAGNEDQNACDVSPASASKPLTVGATDIRDRRSSFSNWGPCVDVFGPGSDIRSAYIGSDTDTAVLSGTSMASPHVAGVGALYLEADPTLTGAAIKNLILNAGVRDTVSDPKNSPNVLINTEAVSGLKPPADASSATASSRCSSIWGLFMVSALGALVFGMW